MKRPFKQFIAERINPGTILIACGLPAAGKTGAAELIARATGFLVLRSDIIRLEILKGEDPFDTKVAGDMNKRNLVYEELFRLAEERVAGGDDVILDATFITQSLRKRAAAIAAGHGKDLVILQVNCPEAVCLERIAGRTRKEYESNALTAEAYYNNKRRFEAVDLDDIKRLFPDLKVRHLVADTGADSDDQWFIEGDAMR